MLPWLLPSSFLAIVVAISAVALVISRFSRRDRQKQIEDLSKEWGMQYSPRDAFNLAPLIASHLPIPGAADVCVHDMLYSTDSAGHRYIFSAEYTSGVVHSKVRRHCVVSLLERRGGDVAWGSFQMAAEGLSLVEQYRSLHAPADNDPTHPVKQ
jgi:hypothetical protein